MRNATVAAINPTIAQHQNGKIVIADAQSQSTTMQIVANNHRNNEKKKEIRPYLTGQREESRLLT